MKSKACRAGCRQNSSAYHQPMGTCNDVVTPPLFVGQLVAVSPVETRNRVSCSELAEWRGTSSYGLGRGTLMVHWKDLSSEARELLADLVEGHHCRATEENLANLEGRGLIEP